MISYSNRAPASSRHESLVTLLGYLVLGACAAASVGILTYLIGYSGYGFDFSDEGFYLNFLANPWEYDGAVSQFAFVYRAVYVALGGDVVSLRVFNILLTFGLATAVALALLRNLGDFSESRIVTFGLAISLATVALICFDSWLVTPNYNTLTLQGLLIASLGLTVGVTRSWASGSTFLVALGLYVTFLAKPTSGVAGALFVAATVILSGKDRWRALFTILLLGLCLLGLGALMIDGSIWRHIQRYRIGAEWAQLLGGGHTLSQIVRLGSFQLTRDERITTLLLILGVAATNLLTMSRGVLAHLCVVIVCLMMLAVAYVCRPVSSESFITLGTFRGLIVAGVPVGALVAVLLSRVRVGFDLRSRGMLVLVPVFLAMPLIYAFGTNSNYWDGASDAFVFWIFAAVTLLCMMPQASLRLRYGIPLASASVALAIPLVRFGPWIPYRQPAGLWNNRNLVHMIPHTRPLILDDAYAQYVNDAIDSAKRAGLKPGTPIIDLTGQSPGLLYALQALSLGQAWIIGGYPGSERVAVAALARVPCEKIAAAWLLVEPEGPRSIPASVLTQFGSEVHTDYTHAADWKVADGAGGYPTRGRQVLYRPIATREVLTRCLERQQATQS